QELSEFGDLRRSKARARAEDTERACDPTRPVKERRRYRHRALDQLLLADRETALFDQGELARVFPGVEIELGQGRAHVRQDRLAAGTQREPYAIADTAPEAESLAARHLGDAQPKRAFGDEQRDGLAGLVPQSPHHRLRRRAEIEACGPHVGELCDRRSEPEPLRITRCAQELLSLQRAQQAVERRPAEVDAAEQLAHRQRVVLRLEGEQDVERAVDGADAVAGLVMLPLVSIGTVTQAKSPAGN